MKTTLYNIIWFTLIVQLNYSTSVANANKNPSSSSQEKSDLNSNKKESSKESEFDAINRAKSSARDHEREAYDNFKAFNDNYYKINWPGSYKPSFNGVSGSSDSAVFTSESHNLLTDHELSFNDENSVWITTSNKERYHCILPKNKPKDEKDSKDNLAKGLNPYQLLLPLFTREICSFRLEQYWSYELCHGKFIRQFHDETNMQKALSQEYYLGKYDLSQLKESEMDYEEKEESWKKGEKSRPTVLIDGVHLPYIEINMTGGTMCDLNSRPRFTRVLYVCNDESRHELSSIKETYTCEYEAIVLTPLLCIHPDFRNDAISEAPIDCYSIANSPTKPKGYSDYEVENRSKPVQSLLDLDSSKIQLEIHKLDLSGDENGKETSVEPTFDSKILRDFLNGDYCLHGGTDWWRYEFCYGNKIEQYHEEKEERKISILLGKWNLEDHTKWLAKNPNKRPKQHKTPKQVSHHYGNGDVCDLTGKPRQVEVKLKCRYIGGNPESVALYLMEPKPCEYILGIESPLICHLLSTIDENGIMSHPED